MDLVTAFVGNLEVIGNGIVHVNENQPLNLLIDKNLEMSFEFIVDSNNKDSNTTTRIEGNKLIWELTNYTNSLGEGIILPIELGTLKERKMYASFFIWTPNEKETRRIINYAIYLEKEA